MLRNTTAATAPDGDTHADTTDTDTNADTNATADTDTAQSAKQISRIPPREPVIC